MPRPHIVDRSQPRHLGTPADYLSRFAPMIWSLASRLTETEAEAQQAYKEILDDLLRCATEFIQPHALDADIVAVIARRRLANRAKSSLRRDQSLSACGLSPGNIGAQPATSVAAPLSVAQQAALGLGGQASWRTFRASSDGPASEPAGPGRRPGLTKLRAVLAQSNPPGRSNRRADTGDTV